MRLLDQPYLWVLGAVPALALVAWLGAVLSRRALARFFGPALGRPWARTGGGAGTALAAALTLGAVAFTALALARPANDPRPDPAARAGRDVVFIIDVSRSMLAQDLRPNRLARAKLAVRDVLDAAAGDRFGLIAFAGTAVVKCPLTTDYTFTRMQLDDLSPNSVSRGGTNIGDAIRAAMSLLFADEEPGAAPPPAAGRSRTIVLLTDGEDTGSTPVEAAGEAGAKGVRIVSIGLGSDLGGAPVPAGDEGRPAGGAGRGAGYVEYQGRRVESKMDPKSLREIAEATPGGVLLNVGTANLEMDRVYARLMRDEARRNLDASPSMRYTERFQWAIAAALLLLAAQEVVRAAWR